MYDNQFNIYIKWENRQVTGSFKVRGALNKVLSMQPWERERGLVGASAGNHGQGLALAGKLVGAPVTIFCPNNAVPLKVEAIRSLGAEVRLVNGGYGEAEQAGLMFVAASGAYWVSPYNDAQVIAGQGTLGLEILSQIPHQLNPIWVIPTGGGGLISGIGAALWQSNEPFRLVAVQSEASSFMHALYRRGTQEGVVDMPTLADGLAGPVEEGSLTIPLVRKFVHDFILVNEEEIAEAIAYAYRHYGEVVDGSGAAALAAIFSEKITSRPAVVVLSGGNIQLEVHKQIIATHYTSPNNHL